MMITFWSVPISDIKWVKTGPFETSKVTAYNVGAGVRHELKHPLFYAWVVGIGATTVVGLLLGVSVFRGDITNWLDEITKAALVWVSLFVLASGIAVVFSGDRAGKKMTALARAAHGADRRVAVHHPVPLAWAILLPMSDDKQDAVGDVMLFTEGGWNHLLASQGSLS